MIRYILLEYQVKNYYHNFWKEQLNNEIFNYGLESFLVFWGWGTNSMRQTY